jgi:sugar phosphate isomerase/epimerase
LSDVIGRRAFLAAAAGVVAGFKANIAFAEKENRKLDLIGLNLSTVRGMMQRSVSKTLATVAKAGYREVEFAGYFNTPVVEIRKMLDDNGLTSPSSHVPIADIGMMLGKLIDEAGILGQQYLIVAWIDGPERTADGYKRIADRFNTAGVRARGDNMQIAYHNNAYEFTPLPGGKNGYEILLKACDPLNVAMEADIFWMLQAKQDPISWFAKYPGRFRLLHLKDRGRAPKYQMLDVGKGVIDWRAIVSNKTAGAKHFIVENEQTKDSLATIRNSYRFLKALRF